jgi:RNA polymerase sigma-70 factor, ECF subfamily
MQTISAAARQDGSETLILRRARTGDAEAGEELFLRYLKESPSISRLLRRLVMNPEDREEMLHEIYMQLVGGRNEFRGESRLSTYVYQVARITIFQKYRKENALKRRTAINAIEATQDYPDSAQIGPEASYYRKEKCRIVGKLIDELPDAYRDVLKLRVLNDLSYEQIAGQMQLPINTVSTKIHKGKKLLQAACKG